MNRSEARIPQALDPLGLTKFKIRLTWFSTLWAPSRALETRKSLAKCLIKCSFLRFKHTVKKRRSDLLEDQRKTHDPIEVIQVLVNELLLDSAMKLNKDLFNKNNNSNNSCNNSNNLNKLLTNEAKLFSICSKILLGYVWGHNEKSTIKSDIQYD